MKKILYFILSFQCLFAGSYSSLLYHGNCFTCHKINNAKSAPSILQVQQAYKNAFIDKNEFVSYMSNWVYQPQEKTSLMHDAIEQYGLMPNLAYDKEVLKEIATFIYETDFSSYKH